MTVAQIEQLCEQLYTPGASHEQKQEAENALNLFKQDSDFLKNCVAVLQHSQSPPTQQFVATTMAVVLTDRWNQFKDGPKSVELRDWIIQFLGCRGDTLLPYVRSAVVRLLVRLIKLAWFTHDDIQDVAEQGKKFLQGTQDQQVLGITILREMVCEIGQQLPKASISVHRKTCQSFRENCLKDIFEMALAGLQSKQYSPVTNASVQLSLACLSFDFLGNTSEDSSDECLTLQVPADWRNLFENTDTLPLFFHLYSQFCATGAPTESTRQCMECLVQLVSVRRGLFSSEVQRTNWLNLIMDGLVNILGSCTGLQVEENHHEFCRLLTRMKGNYQLQHLITAEKYKEWLQLLSDFTVITFKAWNWGFNSDHNVTFLLNFWARLISAMGLVRAGSPHYLEQHVPSILEAYILSKMASVPEIVANDSLEDLLETVDSVKIQIEALPFLRRCEYEKTFAGLQGLFDPLATQLERDLVLVQAGNTSGMSKEDLDIVYGKLTWLVFIIAAMVGGRPSASTTQNHDQIDGKLSRSIIQLMKVQEERLKSIPYRPQHARTMQLAFLYFVPQFRRVYIGDAGASAAQTTYAELTQIGLQDPGCVLELFIRHIISALSLWSEDLPVVMGSLEIFFEFCGSFATSKLLGKIDVSTQLLTHHGPENFPFLASLRGARARCLFYRSLGKLSAFNENMKVFDAFISPLENKLNILEQQATWDPNCTAEFVGACHDLRGILSAYVTRRPYDQMFDCIFPRYASIFLRAAEMYPTDQVVTPAILKFAVEFAKNTSQRISFSSSSANGILLFRFCSELLVSVASRLISHDPSTYSDDLWTHKYKIVWLCVVLLDCNLKGKYVCFGVFSLYNDPALFRALQVVLDLCFSIPLEEMVQYPKLESAFFLMCENLTQDHNHSLLEMKERNYIVRIGVFLKDGLGGPHMERVCNSLHHICESYFKTKNKRRGAQSEIMALFDQQMRASPLFPSILARLLHLIIYAECKYHYFLASALLGLIVVFPEHYDALKQQVLESQNPEVRREIEPAFFELTKDVELDLEQVNQNRFIQNLTRFRHTVQKVIHPVDC